MVFTPHIINVLFQNYTEKTCMFDCAVQVSHKACGCIPWDMPPPRPSMTPGDKDWEVCSANGAKCFKVLNNLLIFFEVNIPDIQSSMLEITLNNTCGYCVPDCEGLSFETSLDIRV